MFWGYTPALDLLREYFWWRGRAPGDAAVGPEAEAAVGSGSGPGSVTVTEIEDPDADGPVHQQHRHVQEDDAADDGGRRVPGELLLPAGGGAAGSCQGDLHGGRPAGGGRAAGEPRHGAGGQPGPVPLADGAHDGRHVHLHGAVELHPGHGGPQRERDHPVRADAEAAPALLPPPPLPPAEVRAGDPARRQEVRPSNGGMGDPLGLFDVDPIRDESADADDSLNILLVGNMDGRHVLKTLSRLHRHAATLAEDADDAGDGDRPRQRKVRFFVAETVMELVARQLLFLLAALEPPDRLGRTEKVRLLLELMGNALVRPSTALWLRSAAGLLVDLVTDPDALRRRLPAVDLSHLRHQDRDRLEEVLSFYQDRPQNFRVGYHWDQRLRRHFGTRYDSRAGAFDWDYYMVLRDLPAGDRVCVHEYRHWRETGVAFTWLEAEQSEPNLSLAAGIVREGCRLLHAGYMGDIVASPFIAYAVELEPEDAAEVFRKANDQYVSRSTDAAERHLDRITFELQHGQDYHPREDPSKGSGGVVLTRVTDESRLDPAAPPEEDDQTLRKVRRAADMKSYAPLAVADGAADAEVVFLSPKFLQAPREGRARFSGRFHCAVLGLGLGERHLDSALRAVLAPEAVVLVEGSRFLLQRPEVRQQAADDLALRAREAGFAPLQAFHPDKDDFAKFVVDAG